MYTPPFVSVILPAYNAEAYICEAIDSMLQQSYSHFELIIVDDGSTDDTWRLINSYQDERIRKERLPQNSGPVNASNHALSLATGEFIARMDADDISFPNRLAIQVEFLSNNSEFGLCGTLMREFQNDINSSVLIHYPKKHIDIITHLIMRERSICHPTVMMRASVLKQHGIQYTDFPYAEDFALWTQLAKHTKLYNIQEPCLYYRRHHHQVSSTHRIKQQESAGKVIASLLQQYKLKQEERKSLHIFLTAKGIVPLEPLSSAQLLKAIYRYKKLHKSSPNINSSTFNKLILFKGLKVCVYYKKPMLLSVCAKAL